MPVTKVCEVCQKQFSVKPSRSAKIFCCSKKCGDVRKSHTRRSELEKQFNQPFYALMSRLYTIEQLSVRQICKKLSAGNHQVLDWLAELEIPIREARESVSLQWQRNDLRKTKQSKRMKEKYESGEFDRHRITAICKTPGVRKINSESKMGDKNPMAFRKGVLNPRWNGGKLYYYGPNWDRQRRATLERDGYTCRRCKKHQSELDHYLHVHHKIKFRTFGIKNFKKANSLSNLETLCAQCHSKAEKEITDPADN